MSRSEPLADRLGRGDAKARLSALRDVPRAEPTPELIAAVIALLRHEDARVRRLSLEVLALGSDSGALAVGSSVWRTALELRRDPDPGVRAEVAVALATLPGVDPDEAAVALLAMLRDEAPEVRRETAAALGDLRVERARDPLAEHLARDPDPDTRFELAFALATLRDPRGLEILVEALGTRRFTDACEGIKRLGDPRGIEPLRAHAARKLLGWPERIVAHGALHALGARAEASTYLLGRLTAWNRGERELAMATLGHLQVPEGREPLERIAIDRRDRSRGVAITALGNLGDRRSVPVLEALRSDGPVSDDVAFALGEIQRRQA